MARKKTARKTTHRKKTAKRKTTARKTSTRKTSRRKRHTPKVAAHGKTAAQRRRYIEYLGAKRKLVKEYFG